jgi:hypothetical protein
MANAQQAGDAQSAAELAEELAHVRMNAGRMDDAEQLFETALARYRATGMRAPVARVLDGLATLRERQGRGEEARRLRDEVAALRASFRSHPQATVGAAAG